MINAYLRAPNPGAALDLLGETLDTKLEYWSRVWPEGFPCTSNVYLRRHRAWLLPDGRPC